MRSLKGTSDFLVVKLRVKIRRRGFCVVCGNIYHSLAYLIKVASRLDEIACLTDRGATWGGLVNTTS